MNEGRNPFGPEEEFEDLDLGNISMGVTDEELEEVYDEVGGDRFQYAGQQCRVRKTETEIAGSRQKDWIAGVYAGWDAVEMTKVDRYFQSEIWETTNGWVEVRVGHERGSANRELAVDEAEWLAEQVVMLENDPNIPV